MVKKTELLKYIGRVLLILLLNFLLISAAANSLSAPETAQTLSKVGSQGEEVRQIQTKLTELGYFTSKIDGIYGEKTKAAVTRFQRDNGLTADGIAGTKTLSALGITSSGGTGGFSSSDINLLARIISAESRGEPYEGQVAVGAVILNRVEHPDRSTNKWIFSRPVITVIGKHRFCS